MAVKTFEELVTQLNSLYAAEGASVPDVTLRFVLQNTINKVLKYCNITSPTEELQFLILEIVKKTIVLEEIAIDGTVASVTEDKATTQYHKMFTGLSPMEYANMVSLFGAQLNYYRKAGVVSS